MRGRKQRHLSAEDRILWSRVARSTVPLPGREMPHEPDEAPGPAFAEAMADPAGPAPDPAPVAVRASAPAEPRGIDDPLRRKIARGRVPIDGKLDLHGLTQAEAHGLLLAFLHRAHAEGRRNLLVVTGKGSSSGGEGVLRRAVPGWLSTPAFRGLVHGHHAADRRHGGDGALYIRLRGRRADAP